MLNNKYTKWYNSIIKNARLREPLEGYKERHHIIPKSLGGTDDATNLVTLSAKEHFICHLLLTKMTVGSERKSMLHAAWGMANLHEPTRQQRYKINSNTYSTLRENLAKMLSETTTGRVGANKGRETSPEWRAKLSAANKGKARSLESVEKQKNTITGRKLPKEHCEAISKGLTGRKMNQHWRDKLGEAKRGKKLVHNLTLQCYIMVAPDDVNKYINEGWILGRGPYGRSAK
jgi:hypothetical protein